MLNHDRVWVFDLDNTLYAATAGVFSQIDARMEAFIMAHLKLDAAQARQVQKRYFREHGTTLKGMMTHHDVQPEAFLRFTHDIDLNMIDRDAELEALLGALPGRKLIYTNGPADHASRVLSKLGIERHFDDIYDIRAADFVPKPDLAPMRSMIERAGIEPGKATMIDDMAKNLRPAHEMGLATVWIRNGSEFGDHDSDGDHVHYISHDVKDWLHGLLNGRAGG